jgi:hypothetical protein
MRLQLVPKAIKLALHGQMASQWADVLGRDPQVAQSVGIDMCTHAAWVFIFQDVLCQNICNCVYHLLYCSSWHDCGLVGTNFEFGAIGLRRQMHACLQINGCVGCVLQTVHLFLHNV